MMGLDWAVLNPSSCASVGQMGALQEEAAQEGT